MPRRILTIKVESAAADPANATKYAITPLAPILHDGEGETVAGVALAPGLDLVVSDVQTIGTLNAAGEATVSLVAESDTRGDADGIGLRYRLTFGVSAERISTPHITFGMPDANTRLEDVISDTLASAGQVVRGWVVSATAPSDPSLGGGWYDSTSGSLSTWDGTAWQGVASTSTTGTARASYLGLWSGLDTAARASIVIGDIALNDARFWVAHTVSAARVTEPGTGAGVDGWHPMSQPYRGTAPLTSTHYDSGDAAMNDSSELWLCLAEGEYTRSELADPNWALINLDTAAVDARIESWARAGATTLVPSDHLPAAEQAQRGAVAAGVADDIDESAGSRQATALAWTATLLRRAVTRIVPTWARTGNADLIPANKLSNAPGLVESAVDARVAAGVEDWAETNNTDQIPVDKLANAPGGLGDITAVAAGAGLSGGGTAGDVSLAVDVTAADFPTVPLVKGGTGAIDAGAARTALAVLDESEVDARIESWAREGATTYIPSDHLPHAAQAARGAVAAGVADDIDESPGSRQTTSLAWTATLIRRAVTRIVPTWARSSSTDQVPVARGGTGAADVAGARTALAVLTEAEVDARAVVRFSNAEKLKLTGAAELAGAVFTGVVRGPTPAIATDLATKAYVDSLAGTTTTVTVPADDSITPPKLDADAADGQDAFLTRLNALRRDLDNIDTLTATEQRAALTALGAVVDGPKPTPTAAYDGRLWIDPHTDEAFVCRNRPIAGNGVQGLFTNAATATNSISLADRWQDLGHPTSNNDRGYTWNDDKFFQAFQTSSNSFYFGQVSQSAVLPRLSTSGWAQVWLGRHDWDGDATALLPHTTLPADTDYFFFNRRTVTIRQLERNTWMADTGPIDHWQWEELQAYAANVAIFDARSGNLPTIAGDGSDDQKLGVANTGIYHVERIGVPSTAVTVGSWATWTYSLATTRRLYRGVRSSDPDVSLVNHGYTLGDFFYDTTHHRFRILEGGEGPFAILGDHWANFTTGPGYPTNFIGQYSSRGDAADHAAQHGIANSAKFLAFTGSLVEEATNFTAGTTSHWLRSWVFLNGTGTGTDTDTGTPNDYLTALVFALASGSLTLTATRHAGGQFIASGTDLIAPLASPTFTGTPTADTAASGTNTKQLATTAFVTAAATSGGVADDSITPAKLDAGTDTKRAAMRARLAAAAVASPVLTGTPTAPTPVAASSTLQIATKAYVDDAFADGLLGDPDVVRTRASSSSAAIQSGNPGTPQIITITALTKGQLLEFFIWAEEFDTKIKSVAYVMSDAILALPAHTNSQIPARATTTSERIVLKVHGEGGINYDHDSIHIWRHATATKLIVDNGRNATPWRCSINSYNLAVDTTPGGATGATGASTLRQQLILHQWGSSEPSSPTVTWGASGWSGAVDGTATSTWVETEPTTAPAGTHWIALATAYSTDSGASWTQGAWSVESIGAGYLAEQYSEDASSWHTTRLDTDSWMRLRRSDGTWTGSIALRSVPWQPILDWRIAYRHSTNTNDPWYTHPINRTDLLAFNDLQMEARFFYFDPAGAPSNFTAISSAAIPAGVVDRNSQIGTVIPSGDLRWQTVPEAFSTNDWTGAATGTAVTAAARRAGVFRAVLDRDAGLSVVLGEQTRDADDDVSYQRATVCFALVTAANLTYDGIIDRIEIYVPEGAVWYSRMELRIIGR